MNHLLHSITSTTKEAGAGSRVKLEEAGMQVGLFAGDDI